MSAAGQSNVCFGTNNGLGERYSEGRWECGAVTVWESVIGAAGQSNMWFGANNDLGERYSVG